MYILHLLYAIDDDALLNIYTQRTPTRINTIYNTYFRTIYWAIGLQPILKRAGKVSGA